jgi:hypothetical protein
MILFSQTNPCPLPKPKTMKKVLTFIFLMMACILQVNAQDQINWVPFECSEGEPVSYVPLQNKAVLAGFDCSWPEEETRNVTVYVDGGGTGYDTTLLEVSGGYNVYEFPYPYPTARPEGAYETIHVLTLSVGDQGLTSTKMAVRTEPTPPLLVNSNMDSEGVVTFSVTSSVTNDEYTGWGGRTPICAGSLRVITTVRDDEGSIVHQSSVICNPGQETSFQSSFEYDGTSSQLCTEVKMVISGEDFGTYVISQADEVCRLVEESPEPALRWVPWSCESIDSVYYVSVEDRTSLVRFEAQWPSDVAYQVKKRFEDGSSEPIGMIYGGEHLIDVGFENQLPFGYYWRSYQVGLQLVENPNVQTSLLFITTEPTPSLEGAVEVVNTSVGDSLILHSTSETQLGTGWGGIASECSEHETYLVHELLSGETAIFRDSVLCNTQSATPPVHELTSRFFYTGEEVELCMRSYMRKIDVSSQPTFAPRTIASDNGDCVTVGKGLPTSITSSSEDERFLVYPNPSTDVFYIRNTDSEPWVVTNALGSVVAVGNLAVVDATSWAKGVYIITLGNKNIRMVRE